jgi:hypothetical protein
MSKKPEKPDEDAGEIYDFLPHPLAETYPLMEGDEFEALVKDIEDNDLIEPITLHEGKILDGRNRYNACRRISHKFGKFDFKNLPDGKDPLLFVISKNSARRHLTTEQKRDVIAKLLLQRPNASSRLIASIARVSHHTVEDVRQKLGGEPEAPTKPAPTENSTGQSAQLLGMPKRDGKDGKQHPAGAPRGPSKTKPLKTIKEKLPLITDEASQKEIFDLLFVQVGEKKIRKWTQLKEDEADSQPKPSPEANVSPPN